MKMDVEESNWVHIASENIDKYLHRGGDGKGNEPQLLGGPALLNTIGVAMGLPLRDPSKFSQIEIEQAEKAEMVFFDNTSLEAINIIANTIRNCCSDENKIFVTVIPIELYYEKKIYEIPIFRVHRYIHSKKYYVDNIGRYYENFDDWYNNNKLPPCNMIYPKQLELKSDGNHSIVSAPYATPSARTETKVLEGVDIAAGVIGIGSALGLMVISGPFAPVLAIAGVATAVWGTGRAAVDLEDRGEHGQSINPFTDSSARMLWLGIAATIASFGAMGVTMRLSSIAARGIQISNALKILTNVANGASLTLNSAAIINNTVYLIEHLNQMSPGEILLNVALLAFWTKGAFAYKRSSVIIRDAQNEAFARINEELLPGSRSEFAELRNRVQNDNSLLLLLNAASKSNISIREYSQFMIDGMHYYDNVARLSPEQTEAFISLRNFLNDDFRLLSGLQRVSTATELNRPDTLELVLSLWQNYTKSNLADKNDVRLIDGNLAIGTAPPIKITEITQLSPSLIRFVGEHLSKIETDAVDQWSIQKLLVLQDRGLFTSCPVTGISNTGHSTVTLNGQLVISLRKLQMIPEDACKSMLKMIGDLHGAQISASSKLPSQVVKLCVRDYRLRFEVHRRESIEWALRSVTRHQKLTDILDTNLMPHEQDRLYTFKTEVSMTKADLYIEDMMNFVSEMNPKNVSELVAYSEFVMTYMGEAAANIEKGIREGTRKLPHNAKKSIWLRQQAKEETFRDTNALKQKLNEFMTIAESNDMFGIQVVEKGLSDEELVAAIRSHRIRFGGKVSATYHIYKHSTDPLSAYIDQANSTMRSSSSQYEVSIGQEGDTRIISFNDANGSAIVLEKDGRVLLLSFRANDRK